MCIGIIIIYFVLRGYSLVIRYFQVALSKNLKKKRTSDFYVEKGKKMTSAFSREHVQRCREMWTSPQFNQLFTAFCQSCQFHSVQNRLELEEIDGVRLALDIIRQGTKDDVIIARAWVLLQNFVLVNRVDDPLEMKPIDIFVSRGGVELAAIEMSRGEPRWGQTLLTILAWTSTNEKAVHRVLASGVHKVGIAFIRDSHPQFVDISMSFIRSASAASACRATLRADGALSAFLPFIDCNKSEEPFQMRRGFRAASVVARLAGNDETGKFEHWKYKRSPYALISVLMIKNPKVLVHKR